ncbi:hypothetical protein [Pseudoalteromonas sp. APM04]|uniref:hypothetical protein n=1 Tax=Pseudoalteromonas sp. APM04 TaxID=2699396 RepID=UPI001FB459D9|nr:hypothetical protein [Pseudoalteromonas sp. APM04]UOB75029.1 hypothetical protein MTP24_07960 [Pseudoalteromonas sp. APM04]
MRLSKLIHNIWVIIIAFCISQKTHAHLIVAQHGTLNVVEEHVFVVLSLPASSLLGVDENNDGTLSLTEFNKYRNHISKQVKKHVYLSDQQYRFSIEGLLLHPEMAHSGNNTFVDQITITGRFTPLMTNNIKFNINLFANNRSKQTYKITATNKQQQLIHQFELEPLSPHSELF